MDKLVTLIFNTLDIVAPLLAILLFLKKPQKINRELTVIFIFCVVQLICNSVAYYMAHFKITNYWVYKINTVASFFFILYLFVKFLIPLNKKTILSIILVFLTFSLIAFLKGDGASSYNSISSAMASLIIVALSLYFFYSKLIHSSPEVSIPSTTVFWCVIGIFTYYAGAFFIFISYKYLIAADVGSIFILWRFHNLLLLICCAYISYGVLCKNYQKI